MDMETLIVDFSDESSGSFDDEEPEIKFQIERILRPIVYTTKLDEMEIFRKDTTNMTVNTIINSVIKESKPILNLKRTHSHTIDLHYTYEDLSYYINTFNRKVARIAKRNNNLLAMCKPAKVVLKDIKHTLLRLDFNEHRDKYTINNEPIPNARTKLLTYNQLHRNQYKIIYDLQRKEADIYIRDKLPTYSQSRRHNYRIIYDLQRKEADMYTRDKSHFIREYNKFRIEESNFNIFRSLKMDKNISHISCCCWYDREKTLQSFRFTPTEALRFMRKPHRCAINLCRCCCRNKTIPSLVKPSSLEPLESHSVWFNRLREVHASLPLLGKSRKTLLSKAIRAYPRLDKNNSHADPVVEIQDTIPFLHSTNIEFGDEFYAIGADGQMKLHLKFTGNDRRTLANLRMKANNITDNICCWYKREEFVGRLLTLGALPNTVNYIRSTHPCSPTNCSCCCKPSKTEKHKLTVLNKSTRHTIDLISRKVDIKVGFLLDAKKSATPRNRRNFVSFNVSLSALEEISEDIIQPLNKNVLDLVIQESVTLDNKSSVRVLVEKTGKHKAIIECSNINNFTTKKLRMLDMIFCAVNKSVKPANQDTTRKFWKNDPSCTYHTIYPLLLHSQLSITTDLRSKRFLPSLRAHLDKYGISHSQIKNINRWVDADEIPDSTNTAAESEANAKENKTVITYKRKRKSSRDSTKDPLT